jgi:hypothetical protein
VHKSGASSAPRIHETGQPGVQRASGDTRVLLLIEFFTWLLGAFFRGVSADGEAADALRRPWLQLRNGHDPPPSDGCPHVEMRV